MKRIFKKSFRFVAERYEEWQQGCCLSRGAIQTDIIAEASSNDIRVELNGIENLRIFKTSKYEFGGSCILPDRIQYAHGSSDMNPLDPLVFQLFFQGDTLSYVRFAMTNPDRIIEFYGTLVELGQAPREDSQVVKKKKIISAESILSELNSYGSMNSAAVMERAVKIYNEYSSVKTVDEGLAIIEGLKLFIKANKLDDENNVDSSSMLKPKILMFIALCNYKICNANAAYCTAKKGLVAIDKALENSPFSGISESMLGGDDLKGLIDMLETKKGDKIINKDYSNFNENIIDTKIFEEICKLK